MYVNFTLYTEKKVDEKLLQEFLMAPLPNI